MNKLFLSPHNDDAPLWGTFTLLRERDISVVTVFDSHRQFQRGTGITAGQRRDEDRAAMRVLGLSEPRFCGFSDANGHDIRWWFEGFTPEHVWAPAFEESGHPQHNLIANLADELWPGKVTHYMTYTPAGKSTGRLVPYEPEWLPLKWKALACYESQWRLENTREHFIRDQHEYYL